MDCFVARAPRNDAVSESELNRFPRIRHRGRQPAIDRDRLTVDVRCVVASAPRNDEEIASHSRGTMRPRFASNFRDLWKSEGAGNAGCALHPRSRVQIVESCAHEHTGQRRQSDIPCAMALRLISALPGDRLSCHRHQRDLTRKLDASTAASGPHDFAVRSRAVRYRHYQRPPQPVPRFVAIMKRPSDRNGMRVM